jgi:DNA-binding response OmpR family regulator
MTIYKGKLLVVDDMIESAEMLADMLIKEGYSVQSAENGKQAIDLVEANPFELVLLDIHMPVMNGFEVFRWMKARDESRNIPVIFLSAYMEAEVRVEGLKMGAVDYISKPCSREELLARVRVHMELYRMRIRLEQQNTELKSVNAQLQQALDNVKTLRGLIPICANCKKIRDDKGYWQGVDKYIGEHTEARLSHGICPDCFKELYPEIPPNDGSAGK